MEVKDIKDAIEPMVQALKNEAAQNEQKHAEAVAQINEEIDRLRHASTQALLTRKDVIIVASVSCIYGLGSPEQYQKEHFSKANLVRAARSLPTKATSLVVLGLLFAPFLVCLIW